MGFIVDFAYGIYGIYPLTMIRPFVGVVYFLNVSYRSKSLINCFYVLTDDVFRISSEFFLHF